jgi:hypothetical protein
MKKTLEIKHYNSSNKQKLKLKMKTKKERNCIAITLHIRLVESIDELVIDLRLAENVFQFHEAVSADAIDEATNRFRALFT